MSRRSINIQRFLLPNLQTNSRHHNAKYTYLIATLIWYDHCDKDNMTRSFLLKMLS